ncbi:MAG: DUF2087 domain-containing protein [Pseudomonadales bacterium]|nr:DUF2087 domain-containing protein [Pseudomonadales bacterium]
MIDKSDTVAALKRMLKGGKLTNIPRRKSDRDLLLALAAAQFARESAYSESDVNVLLDGWLKSFCSPRHVDYVTVRRYLIDLGYLRRDAGGRIYKLYPARLDGEITPEAARVEPRKILTELELERGMRKHIHQSGT